MVKIAFATDDGLTITRHFGRAPFYVVAALEGSQQPSLEQRSKAHHGAAQEPHLHEDGPDGHGHGNMFAPIADCQVLVVGGMGQPAYDGAVAQGLQVILTGEKTIQSALEAYLAGSLVSNPARIHQHRPAGEPKLLNLN